MRPPSKRRLKRETTAVVTELFAWERVHPEHARTRRFFEAHETRAKAMKSAANEEEQNRIFRESVAKSAFEEQEQVAPLLLEMGGRVHYLIGEYQKLGLLSESEASEKNPRVLEHMFSSGYVGRVGRVLEALSYKL